jgi:membrane-associated protein
MPDVNVLPFLLNLFQQYGYPILWLIVFVSAVGIPLPTSLILLAAGAFAALGDFNLLLLVVVTVSAFVAGDNTGYWLGRRWGSRLLDWLERTHKIQLVSPARIARSRLYFHQRGGWAVFLSRFLVSALGGVINILAGAELYPYKRFVIYDICGEALGASLPLVLGLIFGASWEAVGAVLGSLSLFFLALLVALFLAWQAIGMFRHLRRDQGWKKRAHQLPDTSQGGEKKPAELSTASSDEADTYK